MELELKLGVPAKYFFNRLIESVLYDVETQTGRRPQPQHLAGFTYRKKLGNGAVGRLEVTEYRQDHAYAYRLRTGRNQYRVSYQLDDADAGTAVLYYTEDVSGSSQRIDANNRLMMTCLGWLRKRRFKKMAKQIESSYEEQARVN